MAYGNVQKQGVRDGDTKRQRLVNSTIYLNQQSGPMENLRKTRKWFRRETDRNSLVTKQSNEGSALANAEQKLEAAERKSCSADKQTSPANENSQNQQSRTLY